MEQKNSQLGEGSVGELMMKLAMSYNYGAGNIDRVKKANRLLTICCFGIIWNSNGGTADLCIFRSGEAIPFYCLPEKDYFTDTTYLYFAELLC